MNAPLLTLLLRGERDVVAVRQRSREVAALVGLNAHDQIRVATAVSEIARNAQAYAGGGRVEYGIGREGARPALLVRIADDGPGIGDLAAVLQGRHGAAQGIAAARRLMDHFQIESAPGGGTVVLLGKLLPPNVQLPPAEVARIGEALARTRAADPLDEVHQQNQELIRTLEELRQRQEEMARLNQELEDTNRGVVALYAELDETAQQLRRANQLKGQFLSYMSHEFRTPLDSVLALSGLLLERIDGELTSEQERQVVYIRRSARDLLDLVDDLLDTARIEAGQIAVRVGEFTVEGLFGALRATIRPLLHRDQVALVFRSAAEIPPLHSDETKLSHILRNLISNALKFTEQGEVVVSAAWDEAEDRVEFVVADTGIGIPPGDQERIFEDFAQVDSPLQRRVRGTGLGLPLSRKLAELLGGTVTVRSVPGEGSTFRVPLPRRLAPQSASPPPPATP